MPAAGRIPDVDRWGGSLARRRASIAVSWQADMGHGGVELLDDSVGVCWVVAMASIKYGVIIADPPWQYANSGCRGAAENHYKTMSLQDICKIEVAAADDSILFLWATWPQLIEALSVISSWGFRYLTGFPWIKIVGEPSRNLWGQLEIKPQYGVGFWVRGCTEPLLIARRGHVSPPTSGLVGILSENLRHSRKPENIYHLAEQLPGPYLELFARRKRDGWDSWGNEL